MAVFSELVQKYDAAFSSSELIILITSEMLYLIDTKCHLKHRQRLSDLYEIVLLKANPCFFALDFSGGTKLILETVRRTELVIYILTQRDGKDPKPKVGRANSIVLQKQGDKKELLKFEEVIHSKLVTAHRDKMLSP